LASHDEPPVNLAYVAAERGAKSVSGFGSIVKIFGDRLKRAPDLHNGFVIFR
jgi:hypothetical protein